MTHFVDDNLPIPAAKSNLVPIGASDPLKYIQASDWNTVAQGLDDVRSRLRPQVAVASYGALGDARSAPDGICDTSANTKIQSNGITFVAGDVGKVIMLVGAGDGGIMYVGEITAIDSSTQVTVTPAISTTVVDQLLRVGTDDSAAIKDAIDAANLIRGDVVLAPGKKYMLGVTGTVSGVGYGVKLDPTSNTHARIVGHGTEIWFNSTYSNGGAAFMIAANHRRVSFEGITFYGDTGNDDSGTNYRPAIYVNDGVSVVTVVDCEFYSCTPTIFVDDADASVLFVERCVVNETPNGLNGPSFTHISHTHFRNAEALTTRSHQIYLYGSAQHCSIDHCTFENGWHEDVQIRSGSSPLQQKHNFKITNCTFKNSRSYSIWVGSDTGTCEGDIQIIGNTFANCRGPIICQGGRDAIIAHNAMWWDWECPGTPTARGWLVNAIGVTSGIVNDNQLAISQGVQVKNNRLVIRDPFYAVLTLTGDPADGDTVTVAGVVYTFKTTPASTGDVQIEVGDVNDTIQNLWNMVIGRSTFARPMNAILREPSDAKYSPNAAGDGRLVLVSNATFTLTKSCANLTITQAPVDNRDCCPLGIQVTSTIGTIVDGNSFAYVPAPIQLTYNINIRITDNEILGAQVGVDFPSVAIKGVYNSGSYYDGNRVMPPVKGTSILQHTYLSVDDAFPEIGTNPGMITVGSGMFTDIGQRSGWVTASTDGKAVQWLYFGGEIVAPIVEDPQTILFRWSDGDEVSLRGPASYDFTFKRTAPGASQFNSAASLAALIDGKAEYEATVPTPPIGVASYVKIKCATPGDVSATAFMQVTTRSKNNGIMLSDKVAVDVRSFFYGGEATAIKTFVPCSFVSNSRGVLVFGRNAAGRALNPYVDSADIIPGVGFVITHGAASGGEQFNFTVL
jgi:hypothetical protein